ncbi:Nif11-like leader peptide family RiPP precursor [Synechococcus sp. A18-25c]|uniref:Nif11-like leader peptide family RiPP precursor n=1 Tax=Synechococcus sp. A18-25c TaxID=1866938 RepID=UPI00351C6B3A
MEKRKAATTPGAALEIAIEAGFLITVEDVRSMKSQLREVSDEELKADAGGDQRSQRSWDSCWGRWVCCTELG